MKNKRREI